MISNDEMDVLEIGVGVICMNVKTTFSYDGAIAFQKEVREDTYLITVLQSEISISY